MGKILVLLKYVFLIYSMDINEERRNIHVTGMLQDIKDHVSFGCTRKLLWMKIKKEILPKLN
jgi:hypothetical protein